MNNYNEFLEEIAKISEDNQKLKEDNKLLLEENTRLKEELSALNNTITIHNASETEGDIQRKSELLAMLDNIEEDEKAMPMEYMEKQYKEYYSDYNC